MWGRKRKSRYGAYGAYLLEHFADQEERCNTRLGCLAIMVLLSIILWTVGWGVFGGGIK